MKKLILFSMFLFLQSCALDFETDTRIAIKGKIIDANNNPVANVNVDATASKGTSNIGIGCFDCDTRKIMSSKTNANGEFVMFSPIPNNATRYSIYINDSNENSLYRSIYFYDFKNEDFIDYTLNIGTKTLPFNH